MAFLVSTTDYYEKLINKYIFTFSFIICPVNLKYFVKMYHEMMLKEKNIYGHKIGIFL